MLHSAFPCFKVFSNQPNEIIEKIPIDCVFDLGFHGIGKFLEQRFVRLGLPE
jgi:hypothetical protein